MDQVHVLYQSVFQIANRFLNQAHIFSIAELKAHNDPTYDELAKFAHKVAQILAKLAEIGEWDEERIALNARQAALHMEEMAIAINKEDKEKLDAAAAKLADMPFI
ncbi:hypothetical protein [Shewanella algae]|uniref:hypothetical protein n=1 Tax=Shewanella algae TaxID=38313 RepID=UPI000B8A8637|nr:hypothetical protein [Shewanella algae]OXS02405.1 hypothetical protein AMR44_02605 [Shewanella algae]